MPFNATGVYTPATGALSAAPGVLIQSSVWNSIFQDITNALTLLGQQLYGSTPVAVAAYAPIAADSLLLVNFAGAVAITLPAAASRNGYPLAIKDTSGAAENNNITINCNGTETIEGLASLPINVAYGGFNLYPVTNGWIIRP